MLPRKYSKIFRRWLKIANIIPEKSTFGFFAVLVAVFVPSISLFAQSLGVAARPRGLGPLRLYSVAQAQGLPGCR